MFNKALTWVRDRPQPVFIRRNDIPDNKQAFPQPATIQRNIFANEAPRPPRDTLFSGMGRDPQHSPTGIITYGGGLAMADWLSVAGWPFSIAKIPSAMIVSDIPNRGRMAPFRNRPNIISPTPTTLGDLYAMEGAGAWSPELMKITF